MRKTFIGGADIRKQTGAIIIAAITGSHTEITPGPEYIISKGATLVVAGKRPHIKKLKDLFISAP